MADFTPDQLAVLQSIADEKIAENKEIADRNKTVTDHTAKVDALNAAALTIAEKYGIGPGTFQLQPQVMESGQAQQNFDAFSNEVSDLAKTQGLDDFAVQKIQ